MSPSDSMQSQHHNSIKSVVVGIIAAALFLGCADVLAHLFSPSSSPLVALGNGFITASPPVVQEFVISTFGSNNKLVLFISMGIGGALLAASIGALSGRHIGAGAAAFSAVAAILAGLVAVRPDTATRDLLPTVVGAAMGLAALIAPNLLARRRQLSSDREKSRHQGASRRAFLMLTAAGTAAAAVSLSLGRSVQTFGRDVSDAVTRMVLPSPAARAAMIPETASVGVDGVAPFITDNADFYRIDTALAVPELSPEEWVLRIHGLVENEVRIDMAELLKLPLEEHHITLTCVSNPVGGDLLGTATWLGYPMRELLQRAVPLPEADMVLSQSIDGFTASTPLEALTDDRNSLLAVGMNGEPLPAEHGFPARLVVPGLYGYVSATKWVVDLEVTRFGEQTAYWTDRGWDEKAPILVASRIDVPRPLQTLPSGEVVIAGSAWAQQSGIAAVEVQVDGGPWESAELASEVSKDTWRQWRYPLREAGPGRHWAAVRAVSKAGEVQIGERRDPIPNAATGHHRIEFRIE